MAKVSGREDTGLSVGPNGRIDYDEVLKHVGQMGKFQTRVFLLLCLVSALSGLAVFAFGFTGNFGVSCKLIFNFWDTNFHKI